MHTEIVGDIITISQQNIWELKFNIQRGAFESWKVVYAVGFILFSIIIAFSLKNMA